jgi:hypothetical protein
LLNVAGIIAYYDAGDCRQLMIVILGNLCRGYIEVPMKTRKQRFEPPAFIFQAVTARKP